MSVWPEAVWIVREMQSALNMEGRFQELSIRLSEIESRYLIVSTGNNTPDSAPETINNGSLWFRIIGD